MLRYVLMDLRLFDTDTGKDSSRKGLLWLLESLTRWNQLYLKDNPGTPLLYQSGIRYAVPEQFQKAKNSPLRVISEALKNTRDRKVLEALDEINAMCGGEHFRDIPALIENREGDCDNVACYRVAELRHRGIAAQPYITWRRRPTGGMTYHALVRWPDGSSEDPSLLLGMGGEEKAKERAEEIRKNAEREQMAIAALKKKHSGVSIPSLSLPVEWDGIDWGDQ